MKKSSSSNKEKKAENSSLPLNICPVCEKETPQDRPACQNCHAEIDHLRGKKLSDSEKAETHKILKYIRFAHIAVILVYMVSWLLIRTFLWRT